MNFSNCIKKWLSSCSWKVLKEEHSGRRAHTTVICVLHHYPEIAYCEGPLSPPPSPPEEPVNPPEAPLVPQPVVIPQLAQPLILDESRNRILYERYGALNVGGDLRRMVSIINAQFLVERYVEAALVDDGFPANSILANYRLLRGILHSPQGELFTEQTYNSYVTQIRERGTRQSVPYRRILRAIHNSDLFL
ncbi:hypothetical protein L6164_037810 [Bauhinia variegata]|uniref:Uncharacterized protein n=1 Tax=Bauhinia variegata TaxID=167791 RepID=A0ACB9KLY4_BAUVA|nr:hypothetical protein L6164_037810 [Bauhinia variegata]